MSTDRPQIWILLSTDECTVIAVAETADRAKAEAEADAGKPLAWRVDRLGRFVNDEWDYQVGPFEVLPAADHRARLAAETEDS